MRTTLLSIMISALIATAASAQPLSSAITYQGQLKSAGAPANGEFAMVFRLFDAESGGSQVGPTVYRTGNVVDGPDPKVSVTSGVFTVPLDFSAASFAGQERWLEVTVEGTPLTPRQRLAAAPFALHALGPWVSQAGGDLTYTEGNVGIGTTLPNAKLQIDDGAVRLRDTVDNKSWDLAYDAAGDYFYIDEFGVGRHLQIANGGTIGLGAPPDTSAIPFGTTIAGRDGLRVFTFFGDDRPATAIHAEVTGDRGGQGVYGRADTRYHNSQPNPPQPSYGLRGYSFNFNTVDFPDLEDGTNVDSFGVLGEVELSTGIWPGGSGLWAGVIGRDLAAFGTNTYGVYSDGAFAATGTKAFQIDHPLDPQNKILNHYCAEGPEPLNVYSGNAVTDASGFAWVQLPDYFESINRDFRYSLTVVDSGDAFILAKVSQEVKDNAFLIRTSHANVKVSWEVKAVRNDLFVQQHGAPVEVEKGSTHRGKYLSPQLYGQPRDKSIFHHPAPSASPASAGAAASSR